MPVSGIDAEHQFASQLQPGAGPALGGGRGCGNDDGGGIEREFDEFDRIRIISGDALW